MPTEPDYSPVPGEEVDDYDLEGSGIAAAMPSSFYPLKRSRPRSLIPRTFNCRRRLIVCAFILTVIAVSFYLGMRHGHITTGEFDYHFEKVQV